MNNTVRFLPGQIEVGVPEGTLIATAAKLAGVFIDAPCGGNGTCGKCNVLLTQDGITERVLACKKRIETDCIITLEKKSSISALSDGKTRKIAFAPYTNREIHEENPCFAAFDIGTTTVVCYLLDGTTGEQLASIGIQNPQSAYGADVIARANYVLSGSEPDALKSCIVAALNDLMGQVAKSAGRTREQITLVTIVGNTVMHHMLLGYPLDRLVRAPYEPYASERRILYASGIGLQVHANATVLIAPVIGGFVGADTVACLSATAFEQIKTPTLIIDIGTNGEIALTDGTRRICCSTAAGPAFEGANISCGMRAENGAVDHAWIENNQLVFSTIGNMPARGICGSGLIDLVAVLLRLGVIGESGKFDANASLANRLVRLGNMQAFMLTEGETQVYLTQKDIRELQLGKAAMRAGLDLLLDTLALKPKQIEQVQLAGAFGSHLSSSALCDIGLLPESFRGRVESIGNAAGEGAKLYARNFELFEQSETLARETGYIELTTSPAFTNYYVDAMAFPSKDELD